MLQSQQTSDKDDLEITEVRYQQLGDQDQLQGGQVVRKTDLSGTVPVGSPFTVIVRTAAASVEGRAVNLSTGQEYTPTSTIQVDSYWELSFEVDPGYTLVTITADSVKRLLHLSVGLAITFWTQPRIRSATISIPHVRDTVHHQFTVSGTYQDPNSVLQVCIKCNGTRTCMAANKSNTSTNWDATIDTDQRGSACALSVEDTSPFPREQGQTIFPITVVD